MKNLALLIFSFAISFGIYGETKEVHVATGEWAPFTSKDLPGHGMASELVTAAFKEVGYTVVFGWYPWKRCEILLEKGEAWGAIPYVKTPERSEKFDFSDSFFQTEDKFYYKKGGKIDKAKVKYDGLESVKQYRVTGLQGYHYQDAFNKAKLNVVWAADEKSAVEMLDKGRVDLYLNTTALMKDFLVKRDPKSVHNFDTIEPAYSVDQNYVMTSRKYPDAAKITEKFNEGLKKIKANGVFDEINKRYSSID